MALPKKPDERKAIPIATGFIDYFPDAISAVAILSRVGNDQHNPGKPLHWDRTKSGDESEALMRHFLERGTMDSDGVRHSAKVAWRAMALLQKEIESEQKAKAKTIAEEAEAFRRSASRVDYPANGMGLGQGYGGLGGLNPFKIRAC